MTELEYPEYYYPTEFDEEDDEVQKLMVDVFWSYARAHLYNEIHRGKNGFTQWFFITGKKSRDRHGARIQLTERNTKILWNMVNYFNTDEGREELLKIGVVDPPEHIDDLISIIADSKTREETKAEEFRMFLKNRERILKFLSKM
jgi:hypothetical protein